MFNPPIAWVLTAIEILLGGWVVSLGFPVFGGVLMGAAAGSFVTRATVGRKIRKVISEVREELL
jgi:hypothetical protein